VLKKLFKIFVVVFIVLFSFGCSDSKPDKLIVSYTNDLNDSSLPTSRYLQINVFANYDDGSQTNITKNLDWHSSDESIATVSNGLVSAKKVSGDVVISYETKEKFSDGSAVHAHAVTLNILELVLQKITLSPNTLNISVGTSQSIVATGTFEDNSSYDITSDCNWSSSDPNIATVDGGVVTGKSEGNVAITATDANITSNILALEVEKVVYSSLSVAGTKTDFNVKQTIQLEARATNDRAETVVLNAGDVTWESNASDVAEIDSNDLVRALAKGKVKFTGTIKDTIIEGSITLSVIKDKYLRIYKDGQELDFPYTNTNEYETLPTDLSEFTITAIGQDFIISDLNVTDFNGTVKQSASFDTLENGATLDEDNNVTFTLMHDGSERELHYHFKIDDDAQNTFDVKYYETLN